MSGVLRVYLDPAEIGADGYPYAWHHRWAPDGISVLNDRPIKDLIRELAAHRCVRCGHPYEVAKMGNGQWTPCDEHCTHGEPIRTRDRQYPQSMYMGGSVIEAEWRILTVHHLNGVKHDCRWWNLAALCQRCHLTIQAKVYLERRWQREHSEWFKPYAAGWYAWAFLGEELTQRCRVELAEQPGVVLDPFCGSGTTCLVARNHGRHSVGIDLNEQYLALAATRLQQLSLLTGEARPETTSAATLTEGAERSDSS